MVADRIDYRKDPPLQCTVDGVTVAQAVIFGLFGVEMDMNGSLSIRPHRPSFVKEMSLRGLRLRNNTYDIVVHEDGTVAVVNQSSGVTQTLELDKSVRVN